MKNILVTGANGLLGTNTIHELLNKGYQVKGFVRNKRSYLGHKHKNFKLIEGDFNSLSNLMKVTKNVDCIIHCAAQTNQALLRYEQYRTVNVIAVRNLLSAAIKNSVSRFVFVSTANVFGYGDSNNLGHENSKIRYPYNNSFYAKSKLEASEFLEKKRTEIEIVTVNPTFMIGAFDSKPSSGKIVQIGLKNKIVFCPSGGKNFVCVKDVANGVIKAMEIGTNGNSYLLANQNMSYLNFFKRLRKTSGKRFVIITIPRFILLFMGRVGDLIRKFKVKTGVSFVNMKSLTLNTFYSNKKAREELSLSFSSIENGIIEGVVWFENKR